MSRWNSGAGSIERLLAANELQRVPASLEQAERLVHQSRMHAESASAIASLDPVGAYQLAYDAARKALTSVLEVQGPRPTSRGGHIAVYDAVTAQLDPPMGHVIRPFNRMRRRRNENQYPAEPGTEVDVDEVSDALEAVAAIIDMAARMLKELEPF